MKKFEMLGRKLSKAEQKKIIGGFVDPECNCSNSGDRVAHCCQGHGACLDEGWGDCSGVSCDSGTYCEKYCVHSDGSECWIN